MEMDDVLRWIRLLEAERDGSDETDATIDAALLELLESPDEFTARLLPAEKRVEKSPDIPMSVEDALSAMTAVESQRSSIGDGKADSLTLELLTNPGDFWERYFAVLNQPLPSAVALLLRLGSDASMADLKAALEPDVRN